VYPGVVVGCTPRRRSLHSTCSGGIDEHLAAAVSHDERSGRNAWIESLGARGERTGRRRHVVDRRVVDRDENVKALRAAGLDRTCQSAVAQRLLN